MQNKPQLQSKDKLELRLIVVTRRCVRFLFRVQQVNNLAPLLANKASAHANESCEPN